MDVVFSPGAVMMMAIVVAALGGLCNGNNNRCRRVAGTRDLGVQDRSSLGVIHSTGRRLGYRDMAAWWLHDPSAYQTAYTRAENGTLRCAHTLANHGAGGSPQACTDGRVQRLRLGS